MKRNVIIALIMSAINFLSGFGATPSKPDFAYPKNVSANALKDLNKALKKQNGPAIVRATLNYGLAQTDINPDNVEQFTNKISEIKEKVSKPVTTAMLDFVLADVTSSDSLALNTLTKYREILRQTSVEEWIGTIDANPQFTPTLYDFAIQSFLSLKSNDSILMDAIEFNAQNQYPRFMLEMSKAENYESALSLYKRFKGLDVEAYALSELADKAVTIAQRSEAYNLCIESQSPLSDVIESAKSYLTRSDVQISCRNIVKRNDKLKINVKATCINDVRLLIRQDNNTSTNIKEIDVKFSGTGVFAEEKDIELTFPDYGEYLIIPTYEGYKPNTTYEIKVVVTDFLLTQQKYQNQCEVYALDAVSGELQNDVELLFTQYITGIRGNDVYSPKLFNNKPVAHDTKQWHSMNCYTDRAIYRPGDVVRFAATLFEVTELNTRLDQFSKVTAQLYNTNHEKVDKINLTSDNYGRVSGEFTIPKEGLSGTYSIRISEYGSHHFTVTDYKIPTFEVEMSATRLDSTDVVLKGKANGYNGFPIINAQVAIEVSKLPEWVWYRSFRNSERTVIATDTIQTQSDGTFTARIKAPLSGNLIASCIVTSPSGETHETSCFLPEWQYYIDANIPKYIVAGNAPLIAIFDSEGNSTDRKFKTILTSSAQDKSFEPNNNWDNIPSGSYTALIKSDGARDFISPTFYVYRPTDSIPPLETPLFIPNSHVYSGEKILIGTSFDNSHILYTMWTPEAIIEQKWLSPSKGNFFLDVTLPDSVNEATLTFYTLHNYEFREMNVDVVRRNIPSSLNISIESFRNNITPGDVETWTITVHNDIEKPVESAVILNLYSKAFDALQPYYLNFHRPFTYSYYRTLDLNHPWIDICICKPYIRHREPMTLEDLNTSFELYNMEWPRKYYMPYYNMEMMPRMLASKTVAYDTSNVVSPESSMEELGDGHSMEPENQDNDVRMPEIPVALWNPVLTTDSAGRAQIRFIAPNATTTWVLKALAYNKSLLSGTFSEEITSSKPVMVQPNLPRFLREGDKIQLRASVINNTALESEVNASFEIFEPTTEQILFKKEFALSLNAMSSDVISIDYIAPANSILGVRVKANTGSYTDGEQTILPVLPNEISVITARSIYLDADSSETDINVPKGGAISFTANAVWQCVAALPGLQTSESGSAFSAVSSLFSAATARGLMRKHPEIGLALHNWKSNDSILISRLSQNDDLKIALLSSTPFEYAARSETEQRARLYLLFDKSQTEQVINKSIHSLAKLVRNGGLTWTGSADEPSLWVTLRVLSTLANLKRLGYMPDNNNLNRLIENAVKYLDSEIARKFNDDKNAIFPEYVLMRSQFPNIRQTSPAKRAALATVQHFVANWRDESSVGIAKAAIILYENGYQTTARNLIESLRQHEIWNYSEISPYYLKAFHLVSPSAPEVDMLRSAYISRLHSMDWGNHSDTSDLIATLLDCGTDWLVPAANEISVKINGAEYDVKMDDYMGEFRINLPEGGNVEISKGNFPAWGGVFSKSNDSIQTIEAFETDKLKITRTIEGEMKVGAKVTLKLSIKASQDLDYVVVRQPRCAAFEPQNQLPSTHWLGHLVAYREPCSSETNWYFNRITKGETIISETFYVTAQGTFALAPAEVQSQYAPEFKAHSTGREISISE